MLLKFHGKATYALLLGNIADMTVKPNQSSLCVHLGWLYSHKKMILELFSPRHMAQKREHFPRWYVSEQRNEVSDGC